MEALREYEELETDGNLYPCMQFVNNEKFIIGNCKTGIDENARADLIKNSKKEEKVCKECAIRKRCKHTCPCKNYVLCDDINKLSPIVCETEKIFVEISDKMAEYLYNQHSKLFMQKYYNKNYHILKEFVKRG